jgi:hypothetical protein
MFKIILRRTPITTTKRYQFVEKFERARPKNTDFETISNNYNLKGSKPTPDQYTIQKKKKLSFVRDGMVANFQLYKKVYNTNPGSTIKRDL